MNKKTRLLLVLLILFLGLNGYSQTRDAGLWVSGTLEKRLSDAFAVQLSEEVRLMENISEAATVFTDLGLEYRITKPLKVSLHYRHLFDRRLDDSYERNSRFYADVSYKFKLSNFSLLLRERMQATYAPFNSSDNINPEWYSRTKATLKPDLDRNWNPLVFAEAFTPITHSEYKYLDKLRYGAGFEWSIRKKHVLDLSYMIQSKFQNEPESDFIFVIGYSYSL
jgi:hypothetical protein